MRISVATISLHVTGENSQVIVFLTFSIVPLKGQLSAEDGALFILSAKSQTFSL
jgi:hypothetical protein